MTCRTLITILCVYALSCLTYSQTLDLISSDDGFVARGFPDDVFRDIFLDVIRVRSPNETDLYYFRGFVGWDFPANRTSWEVISAKLILYFGDNILVASGETMTLCICNSTQTWNSGSITWNNMADFLTNYANITTNIIPPIADAKMVFDVTTVVTAWLPANPSPARLTFMLIASGSDETEFASRRSVNFTGPTMSLELKNPPPTAGTPTSNSPTQVTPNVVNNVNQPSVNGTAPPGPDALGIGLGVSLSVAGAAAIFLGVFFGVKKMQKKKKKEKKDEDELTSTNSGETIYGAVPSLNGSPSGSPNISNEKNRVMASQIKLEKEIGSGNYGKVFIAKFSNAKVAVKYYHQIEALQDFQHEADLYCKMKPHPNIVQLIGICTDGAQPAIVLEYCNGGSLEKYLKDNPDLSFNERLKLMYGTACGVYHLHTNDIVHRDLAARNILLNRGQPKISDFGMSRFVTSNEQMGQTKTNIGPVKWMAPESIASQVYSPKSDVWMFANVCFEILTGKAPFDDEDIFAAAIDIRDKGAHEKLPEGTDQRLVDIIEKCWSKDPKDRPSMETVIAQFEQNFEFLADSHTD